MTKLLLAGLLALSLTACASHSTRGDSPVSDLSALRQAVSGDLEPRQLPNGLEYCAELATTEKQQDECLGQLEDALFLSNGDKARAIWLIDRFIERTKIVRNPCSWYEFSCKSRAKELGL